MAPKAKQGGPQSLLGGKPYKEHVQELFSSTAMQPRDIDQKAVHLLDAYHKAGKAEQACAHLKGFIEKMPREKVQNWRAYSYKILRGFDEEVYKKMKDAAEGNRRQPGSKNKKDGALNASAAEFQPGQWWQGMQPATPTHPMMGYYPMNMMMMPMMPQMAMAATGAPPPPPAEAAKVPKAAASEAPAPEKPADATVSEAKGDEKPAEADKPAEAEAAR